MGNYVEENASQNLNHLWEIREMSHDKAQALMKIVKGMFSPVHYRFIVEDIAEDGFIYHMEMSDILKETLEELH